MIYGFKSIKLSVVSAIYGLSDFLVPLVYNDVMSIRFRANKEKIKAAVLFCIQESGGAINVYHLNKILFAADKHHLNKYGRPVTGDTYIAMEHGTVPSKTRDMMGSFTKRDHFIFSSEAPDMRKLSASDLEAIKFGFGEYAGLTFDQVREKNHLEKAWRKTMENKEIDFELMIENEDIRRYIEENGTDIIL